MITFINNFGTYVTSNYVVDYDKLYLPYSVDYKSAFETSRTKSKETSTR